MADLRLLADPKSLSLRLGVDVSDPLLLLALQRTSDRFRGEVGHSVTTVSNDSVELDGDGSDVLLLPAAPIIGVTSVTVAGTSVTDFQISKRWGFLRRTSPGYRWPDGLGLIVVVYTHGYDEVPGDIADAVTEQAEQQYFVLAGIDTARLGPQQISFGKMGQGVTQRWSDTVARYQIGRGDRP